GHLAEALITIAKCAVYKPAYYADLLYESLRKDDNFEKDLLQVVLCRVDIDLDLIKIEFKNMYQMSLSECVRMETSGDFQKLMLEILKDK
ncbi:unnamed protein product, partial [Brachionus calyciflorus]